MKRLFYFFCFLIAYGSLYPFDFSFAIFTYESWEHFLGSLLTFGSIGDILGNVVLFFPFGFLGKYAIDSSNFRYKYTVIIFSAFLFALILQLLQIMLISRDPILGDVILNLLGTFLGLLVAESHIGKRIVKPTYGLTNNIAEVALLLLWFCFLLTPFVPTIDFSKYKYALKPLLFEPEFTTGSFMILTAGWLVTFRLIKRIFPLGPGYFIPASVLITLFLQVVIVNTYVALHDVLAGFLALIIYAMASNHQYSNPLLLSKSMLAALIVDGLRPYGFDASSNTFHWLLFQGALTGAIDTNISAIASKLFLFGAIIWLHLCAKRNILGVSVLLTLIVLVLEVCQIWLTNRSAEITDPFLVVCAAWFMMYARNLEKQPPVLDENKTTPSPGQKVQIDTVMQSGINHYRNYRNAIILLGAGCITIMLSITLVLQIPSIPYNVKELFRFNANGIDLFFFALAMLGFGIGSAWTGYTMSYAKRPWLSAPMIGVLTTIIIYSMLLIGVTRESIADISGSTRIVYLLADKQILGGFGSEIVHIIGRKLAFNIALIFEPIIRFGALVGPVILFMGFFLSIYFTRYMPISNAINIRQLLFRILYLLPWLFFAKVIAFDWSSTDNLNELIARDNKWGINGGPYLYALVLMVVFHASAVAWSIFFNRITTLIFWVFAFGFFLPLGWMLINAGLVEAFQKYSSTYSGVDFLLGPDRVDKLSSQTLMIRWAVVQISGTLLLAYSAIIFLKFLGKPYTESKADEPMLSNKAIMDNANIGSDLLAGQVDQTEKTDIDSRLKISLRYWQIEKICEMAKNQSLSATQLLHNIIEDEWSLSRGSKKFYLIEEQAIDQNVGDNELIAVDIQLTPPVALFIKTLSKEFSISQSDVIRRLLCSHFIRDK